MLLEDQEVAAVKLWGQDSPTVAPEGQGGELSDPGKSDGGGWPVHRPLKVCSAVLMEAKDKVVKAAQDLWGLSDGLCPEPIV